MKCKIVPASKEVWEIYASWVRAHDDRLEGRADGWIFIGVDANPGLLIVSGARLLIGQDAVMLDDFCAHPELPEDEFEVLAVLTVRTAMSFATTLGKQLRARGLENPAPNRILEAQGFQPAGPALPGIWFAEPGLGPFEVPLPKRSPAAPKNREASPATTSHAIRDKPKVQAAAVRVKSVAKRGRV